LLQFQDDSGIIKKIRLILKQEWKMTEKEFKDYLGELKSELNGQSDEVKEKKLKALTAVLIVKDYEQVISVLKADDVLSAQQYEMLKKNYMVSNKYLMFYGIGSRIFGEIWAIQQLKSLDSRFKVPDTTLDPLYCGEYDLLFEGAKIGAKACRAVNVNEEGDRFAKAMHYDTAKFFAMHFRQLRIESCEFLVLIGVWMDQLVYWVLPYKEIKDNKYFVQYKGEIEEGLLVINDKNISDFEKFRVAESKVVDVILSKKTR
jgi:hypothetical protein